jgi:hypothetical protein
VPQIKVTFSASLSGGAQVLFVLSSPGTPGVKDMNFAAGDEVRFLEAGKIYVVQWHIVGSSNDTITVTWKTSKLQGTLVNNFKLDRNGPSVRPFPGGKWIDHELSFFGPV